jgi:SecD/SecF fusion protein
LSPENRDKEYPISSIMNLSFQFDKDGEMTGYIEGSVVGYAAIEDTATLNIRLNHGAIQNILPLDLEFMWDHKELEQNGELTGIIALHAIKVPLNGPKVDNGDVQKASLNNQVEGEYTIDMKMNEIGADKWKRMTTDNLNKQIAIIMDDVVFCVPVVNGVMDNSSSIMGNFTLKEAKDLVAVINAGRLPVPVKIIQIENL